MHLKYKNYTTNSMWYNIAANEKKKIKQHFFFYFLILIIKYFK